MAYLVHNVDSLKIVGAWRTLAEAQAAAAGNLELTFVADNIALPLHFTPEIDNLWYYYDGKIQPEAKETNQLRLILSARYSYDRLRELSQMIRTDAIAYQIETLNKGYNFIAGGLQALYIIIHRSEYTDSTGSRQNYMLSHKIDFCNAFPAPESEILTAKSFLSDVSTSALPTGPVTWVDHRTATSVSFDQSITLSGTSPDDGSAYNLNLLASEIPDTVNVADGEWIRNLTIMLWGPPTNLRTIETFSDGISWEWDAPTVMGDEPLTNYVLQTKQSSAADTEWRSLRIPSFLTEGQTSQLLPNTQYDIRMASLSESGQGPWSPVLQVSTMG